MDHGLLFACNLVAILMLVLIGAIIGDIKVRSAQFGAWLALMISIPLSLLGWIIYVAVHFISRYW